MGITPTALSGSITTSAVQTELSRVRTWANTGIVVGDFAALGVTRAAIYRPNVYGFPLQGSEGVMQDAWFCQQGAEHPTTRPGTRSTATGRLFLAQARRRTSVFTNRLYDENQFRFARVAKRFTLDVASYVEVALQFEAIVVSDWGDAASDDYPDPAGTFGIYYQEVGATSATRLTGSRRRANLNHYAAGSGAASKFNLYTTGGAVASLAAGTYDLWLQYDREASTVGVEQVVVGVASLKIEVHKP